jgi:hypothetical protein
MRKDYVAIGNNGVFFYRENKDAVDYKVGKTFMYNFNFKNVEEAEDLFYNYAIYKELPEELSKIDLSREELIAFLDEFLKSA